MLILSGPDDPHARAVSWALARNGITTEYLYWRNFPSRSGVGFSLSSQCEELALPSQPLRSAAWYRRPITLEFSGNMEDEERAFARREAEQSLHSILLTIERRGSMTNGFSSIRDAAYKPYQLSLARSVGFDIPNTIVSNEPNRIRDFYTAVGGRMIFKPMSLPQFTEDGALQVVNTTLLELDHLKDDALLAAAPAIFQEALDKVSEIRILVLPEGRYIAVRFKPDACERIDWRGAYFDAACEIVTLPSTIANACHSLLASLGLQSGSIDLLERLDGSLVFLEINSEGQFLFLEERMPETRALQHFTTYLMRYHGYGSHSVPLSLLEFKNDDQPSR
jgi:glutathione synthase/RimK-type ligase-like ATP-grasp enzyme